MEFEKNEKDFIKHKGKNIFAMWSIWKMDQYDYDK